MGILDYNLSKEGITYLKYNKNRHIIILIKFEIMAVERKEIDTKKIKECGLPLLWMLGGPGSGKSTQCVMLSKVKEMILISPEDLVKEQAEQATPRGHQLSKAIEGKSWKALETPVIVDIIIEAIDYQLDNWFGNPEGKPKGIILDGFPNNLEQAKEFVSRAIPATKIIHISLEPYSLMERLMAKGSTDFEANESVCAEFQKDMVPIFTKYEDKVIKVDGSEMSFLITADITSALMKFKI